MSGGIVEWGYMSKAHEKTSVDTILDVLSIILLSLGTVRVVQAAPDGLGAWAIGTALAVIKYFKRTRRRVDEA